MPHLENFISKKIGRAIFDYKMIENDDVILVGVSGGKDSLTLLYDLVKRQKSFPIRYTLKAAHIISDFTEYNKDKIENVFKDLGVEYHLVSVSIIKRLKPGKTMNCYWCSSQRRIELFELAKSLGCNKIALGHHLDDIVETILMNMFYNGKIAAMKPVMKYERFNNTIIRPLAYVKEEQIRKLAAKKEFINLVCNCKYGENSKRLKMKSFIKMLEKDNKAIRENIFKSLKNVESDYLL